MVTFTRIREVASALATSMIGLARIGSSGTISAVGSARKSPNPV